MANQKNGTKQPMLPDRVVIVDDEAVVKNAMAKALFSEGVREIQSFADPQEAWQSIESKPPQMLVLDWKMDGMTGAQVLQRCRANPVLQDMPILVVSGFLNRQDFHMMDEYILVNKCEKPITAKSLIRAAASLWSESLWFAEQRTEVNRLVKEVLANPRKSISPLLGKLSTSPRPLPICLTAVRILIEQKALNQARDLTEWILAKEPNSPAALTMRGKVLILLHQFNDAIQILEKARTLFPENPERLCLLGDASLNMFDTESASRYFSQARKQDPTWERAAAGQALTDNVGTWLSQSDLSKAPTSFAAMLNAIGVSMVRTGRFDDGVHHYETAMEYVSQAYEQARLAFNLGLGYARWQKHESAADWFAKSAELSKGKFDKPLNQLKRLEARGVTPSGNPVSSKGVGSAAEVALGMEEERLNPDEAGQPEVPAVQNDAVPEMIKPAKMDDPRLSRLLGWIAQLNQPDPTLFTATKRSMLKGKYDAYSFEAGGAKGVIFIPKPLKPIDLQQESHRRVLMEVVQVVIKVKGLWKQEWPKTGIAA